MVFFTVEKRALESLGRHIIINEGERGSKDLLNESVMRCKGEQNRKQIIHRSAALGTEITQKQKKFFVGLEEK